MSLRSDICDFIKNNSFKGRQKSFNFDSEGLNQYINWAFVNDYISIYADDGEIKSTIVTYRVKNNPKKIEDLLPSDEKFKDGNICIMDLIANDKNSRQQITKEFMKKHPNWKSLKKWAIRNGSIVELNNKYIELVGGNL
jgi:hypothetical protein